MSDQPPLPQRPAGHDRDRPPPRTARSVRSVSGGRWPPSLPALVVLGMIAVAAGFALLAADAPPLLAISAVMLMLGALAVVPRRWTTAIAGVLGATLVVIGSLAQPFTAYHLSRPGTRDFTATMILLAGGAVAGSAGIAAAGHARAGADRRAWPPPAWGPSLLTGLIGLCVGATVFGAVARQPAPAAADPALADARAEVIVAEDIRYTAAPEEISSGEVVFELRNDGGIEHDVTVAELDDRVVAAAQAGETVRAAVHLDPGTYTYYCSVPGHRDAGMEGSFDAVP